MASLNFLCSVAIFVAVVSRLAMMSPASRALTCYATHFVWAGAHILIALGAVAMVLSYAAGRAVTETSGLLINVGLCLLLMIRWRRRRADRTAY